MKVSGDLEMKRRKLLGLGLCAGLLVGQLPVALGLAGQYTPATPEWNKPVKAFRVIGNIYYVGASEVSSFLITTPKGHILLDSGFAETVPLIQDSFRQLGFNLRDVKILINSHAHYDHAAGLALLKEMTGANLLVSEADAELLANGGRGDPQWGDRFSFRPVTADRFIRDNEKIELGGVTMTARLTPGHTRGCTTWTMSATEGGKQFDVVFLGSTTAPEYRLVDNPRYPDIVADFDSTFRRLRSLPCDVFLGPHGSFFSLEEKMKRLGQKTNPFIDSKGYLRFIEQTERAYRERLQKQQSSKTR
jgi:metallo-beta-lactamase class B